MNREYDQIYQILHILLIFFDLTICISGRGFSFVPKVCSELLSVLEMDFEDAPDPVWHCSGPFWGSASRTTNYEKFWTILVVRQSSLQEQNRSNNTDLAK